MTATIFPVPFSGVTFNVPLEKLKKDRKMPTIPIFIKSKNENMNPKEKMSDFDRVFEF